MIWEWHDRATMAVTTAAVKQTCSVTGHMNTFLNRRVRFLNYAGLIPYPAIMRLRNLTLRLRIWFHLNYNTHVVIKESDPAIKDLVS